MLRVKPANAPNGLEADLDAALLLRKLGAAVAVVSFMLVVLLLSSGEKIRLSLVCSSIAGFAMLWLAHLGRFRASAYVLCWGLLLTGSAGMLSFGLRSSGSVVIPLAIISGGWLLGRIPALFLSAAASVVTISVLWGHLNGHFPIATTVQVFDGMALVAIFSVTAMLATAMVATLHRQYNKVNTLAVGLQEANTHLERRVQERSTQLAEMQKKAMDSERLTSLGSMVAGISHELNTPLGNALIVSTTLEAQVRTLSQRVEQGKLTRTDMAQFLSGAAEMALLTTQSITRAADLVASFKQVAVDQTSEQRRPFLLDRVVSDNVAALMPSLGRIQVQVVQAIPADIRCDSFPGPLGQILTNLVQNAAVHGFDGKAQGHIQISASTHGDQVELVIDDDGVGMDNKVLMHVFDPFFTTRLGQGGSGLGLSVSYRIATSVLGGSLSARSEPGRGSSFTLTFPLQAPAAIIDP
jgi:signal transduction histidine kinase